MDTYIQLGSFIFQNMEIPEKINFGGTHQLVQHNLIGGNRVIDALGKNDIDISWSGLMTGPDALTRAQQLNQLRAAGQQLTLTWFNLNYNVIIQNFVSYTERYYQVRYEISLRVITDGANPISTNNLVGFNEAINGDLSTANTIAANIYNQVGGTNVDYQPLISAMTALTTAIQSAGSLNGASPSLIQSIYTPLINAQNAVTAAITPLAQNLYGTTS